MNTKKTKINTEEKIEWLLEYASKHGMQLDRFDKVLVKAYSQFTGTNYVETGDYRGHDAFLRYYNHSLSRILNEMYKLGYFDNSLGAHTKVIPYKLLPEYRKL